MARSTVRLGNLGRAFGYGRSDMYNHIAQIYVLYEDLKIETGRLFTFAQTLNPDSDVTPYTFEILYYIRRSVASLLEYRGALGQLCRMDEFKAYLPSLPDKHRNHILEANAFLIDHHHLIKTLRNDIGGHFQFEYACHATANFPSSEVGKIEWNSDSEDLWSLNIDLAANIVVAGLEKVIPPKADFWVEFRSIINALGEAYRQIQTATYALTHGFLWNRLA